MREVAACIYGMAVFSGGRWFRSHMECVDFTEKHIPEGQFQWFIDTVCDLQFVTGEKVSTAKSQRDEVHAAMVQKTKDQ